MPSRTHEGLVELFRLRPELAAELLTDSLGLVLPRYEQAQLAAGESTDFGPSTYQADAVVAYSSGNRTSLVVVIEVQLSPDSNKVWSWPVYLSAVRARHRCPAVLLVMCTELATATWCSKPIEYGHPGLVLRPLVLGPDRFPAITDVEEARRSPELAVLSAMAHGDQDKVLHAFVSALASCDDLRNAIYADLVMGALPEAARRVLEDLVGTRTYEYQSDFVRRYIFQGRAEATIEAQATAILTVLAARGLSISEDARSRITSCSDADQLDAWLRRAATVDSVDDVFD